MTASNVLESVPLLVSLVDLIKLAQNPEYQNLIPELVEARETVKAAEDFRKEKAEYVDKVAADAKELADQKAALADREAELIAKEVAVQEAETSLAATSKELADKAARIADAEKAVSAREERVADAESRIDLDKKETKRLLEETALENAEIVRLKETLRSKLAALGDL